jgi:hypothetical protein
VGRELGSVNPPALERAYGAGVSEPEATGRADDQRIHLLEIPVVWFGLQLVEWAIVVGLIWPFVPPTWPVPLQAAVWVVVLGAVTALNFAIRRRFVPR